MTEQEKAEQVCRSKLKSIAEALHRFANPTLVKNYGEDWPKRVSKMPKASAKDIPVLITALINRKHLFGKVKQNQILQKALLKIKDLRGLLNHEQETEPDYNVILKELNNCEISIYQNLGIRKLDTIVAVSKVLNRLTTEQKKYIHEEPSSSGSRRLRGSAGSGKTLVLAARAAEAVNKGKRVLFLVYSKPLEQKIQNIINTYEEQKEKEGIDFVVNEENIKILNFFKFLLNFCMEELKQDFKKNNEGDFDSKINEMVTLINDKFEEEKHKEKTFDAIYVDEAQNFDIKWWPLIRKFLNKDKQENPELYIAADVTQDYRNRGSRNWTDESMKGCGFKGRWRELNNSYRMHPLASKLARIFILKYLPSDESNNLPQYTPTKDDPVLPLQEHGEFNFVWHNCSKDDVSSKVVNLIEDIPEKSNTNSVILCSNNIQKTLIPKIKDSMEGLNNCFAIKETTQVKGLNSKEQFFIENGDLGIITSQSYQGLESHNVILILDYKWQNSFAKKSIYVAITRVLVHENLSSLNIINLTHEFSTIGQYLNRKFEALKSTL